MGKLQRELNLLDVFCMASGSMISSGLFILPALAYLKCGASVILVYIIASVLVLPATFAQSELATAMPKSGGSYFYVERSLGSAFGLFTGLANWFSIAMKSAFALVGMAVFIDILIKSTTNSAIDAQLLMKITSTVCCLFFITLNILSVKHAAKLQNYLVIVLFITLAFFVFAGVGSLEITQFSPFFRAGNSTWTFIGAIGMVFVSFGGLTKITSVSEEIKNPPRNIPLGMFLAWFIVSLLYFAVVSITVGVMDSNSLENSLTPISDAAKLFAGIPGYLILSLSAMTAFITTANAGLISASRALMAMSKDEILPNIFSRISAKFHTPYVSIVVTGLFMILSIIALDLEHLVKAASSLMLTMFSLMNLCVIVMRQSKIQAYRPTFVSPLYPYMQIVAILIYLGLIISMGISALAISLGFTLLTIVWYYVYVAKRVSRTSAIMQIVERVTDKPFQSNTLENELRDILLERDEIIEDRFDKLIRECEILDIDEKLGHEDVFKLIAATFNKHINYDAQAFYDKLIERESQGSTVIQTGLAIPHVVIDGENMFEVMLVRSISGIDFPNSDKPVHCIFVLAGTKDERNYHLRALMAIAQVAQQADFRQQWMSCRDRESLRNIILLSSRTRQK